MDRTKLSLDFNQTRKVPRATFREYTPTILSSPKNEITNLVSNTTPIVSTIFPSPEFKGNMLNINQPEHILLPLTPIPTPLYLANSNLTESDHEAYMKGFLDAIVELQRQNSAKIWPSNQPTIPSFVALTPVSPYKPQFDNHEKTTVALTSSSDSFNSAPINLSISEKNCKQVVNNPFSSQNPFIVSPMTTPQEEAKSFHNISSTSHYSPLSSPTSTSSKHQSSKYETDSDSNSNVQALNTFLKSNKDQTQEFSQDAKSFKRDFEKFTESSTSNKESKELARLARRREKNRNAARKCRTKKLERIASLEERVKQLKSENQVLLMTLDKNKLDVYNLQKNLSNHINQKECKLFPNGKALV